MSEAVPAPKSGLAIFDVDGTLTDTNAVDDECYRSAVAEVLALNASDLGWSHAPHVTDAALLDWLAQRFDVAIDAPTRERVLARFLECLRRRHATSPSSFLPVAGAAAAVRLLPARGWEVALATGGWSESARFKLAAADIDVVGLPFASATDAATRAEILVTARRRASPRLPPPARIVAVGDAPWDVRAAIELDWPFVGVGTGAAADTLCSAGAATVVPDLSDLDALCEALATALVPHTPTRGSGLIGLPATS